MAVPKPNGIAEMRSNENTSPLPLDETTLGQMVSNENNSPLAMDDNSVL